MAASSFRVNFSRVMTLPTDYTLTSGFSKLTQFLLLACMHVRYGLLLSFDKAERWIIPYRNGFWQCWKGLLESETPCNMHKWSIIYLSLNHPVNHFGPLRYIWYWSRGSRFESSGPQKRCFCARCTLRRITFYAPERTSKSWSVRGIGYLFLTVILLRAL